MVLEQLKTRIIAPHRIVALTDGVYAIVMTILVLELSVPIVMDTAVNKELSHGLLEMWSEFLIYGLSFFVLGVFWLMHHFIFDSIKQYDPALSWINIFFLMCTGLIPFSTALFGAYGAERITALIYGINIFFGFLGLWGLWLYATVGNRLVNSDVGQSMKKGGNMMAITYLTIILIALGISFINPLISFILYFLIVVAVIILTAIGKTELVTVLPVTHKTDEQRLMGEEENKI
jgi:uncharacterized membrane protein